MPEEGTGSDSAASHRDRSLRVLPAPRGTRDGGAAIWVLYEALERLGVELADGSTRGALENIDICHMHWPEYAMGADRAWQRMIDAGRFLGKLALMKMHGARLIWTAHNIYPHDTPPRRSLEAFYFLLFHLLDGLIFLNEASRDLFHRRHPRSRTCTAAVIPAAHVRSIFADVAETGSREADSRQFLFFGVIRPYKGLDRLMTAFGALADPRAPRLRRGRLREPRLHELDRAARRRRCRDRSPDRLGAGEGDGRPGRRLCPGGLALSGPAECRCQYPCPFPRPAGAHAGNAIQPGVAE